jgi:hypothetical protein
MLRFAQQDGCFFQQPARRWSGNDDGSIVPTRSAAQTCHDLLCGFDGPFRKPDARLPSEAIAPLPGLIEAINFSR